MATVRSRPTPSAFARTGSLGGCGPDWWNRPRRLSGATNTFTRSFLAWILWLGHLEWRADMRWPSWLYALNDPLDPWFGDDKASHWLGAAFAMCKSRELLTRIGSAEWAVVFWSWAAVILVILLVEIVEYARYEKWEARGKPQPWPWLTDRVSAKDVGWGLLGAWMATW